MTPKHKKKVKKVKAWAVVTPNGEIQNWTAIPLQIYSMKEIAEKNAMKTESVKEITITYHV